jgi:RNA polymerase sigma-70 factor (ECF subfamily)
LPPNGHRQDVTTVEGTDQDLDEPVSEAALVEELRHGSRAALAELFDRYADTIYTYCFRRSASWPAAEDATSTVFLEAWRSRASMRVLDGSALPWLYGIANNVCRNSARSRRRMAQALNRVPREGTAPDHAEQVAARLDSERRMRAVLDGVRRLPRHEQEVLALVVWSRLTYEQAAAALDVPVGTVRSRLSRARRRLGELAD